MKQILILLSLGLGLLLTPQAQAQEPGPHLEHGEQVVVTCDADQLLLIPLDARTLKAVCLELDTATATPTPTEEITRTLTPFPLTDTPTATSTATDTATLTPAPLTATPTSTATATLVPSTGVPNSTPNPNAPLCPTHDPQQWHALWDATRGCHYDHTHNADPASVNAIFGQAGALWGNQTLSYPWATSAMENTHKHGGYKYAVRTNIPCDVNRRDGNNNFPVNCITDARIEYHAVGHAMDALARFHSFYAEYRICKYPAFTECGILRTGGWMDFGILQIPYKVQRVVRPGGALDFGAASTYGGAGANPLVMSFPADASELNGQSIHDAPYLAMSSVADIRAFQPQPNLNLQMEVWSSGDQAFPRYGHNPYASFTFRIFDSWGLMNPANPNQLHWFCRDGNCEYNSSLHAMNELWTQTPANVFDPDGNGFADWSGYTDRYGNIANGCTAPALDCVPLTMTHVPVGIGYYQDAGNGGAQAKEFDLSPNGVKWLRYPN